MNLGTCPYCETLMTNVNVEDVSIDVASRPYGKALVTTVLAVKKFSACR